MNINDKVSVILTEHGKKVADDYKENYMKYYRSYMPPLYDENGKLETQLWDLMYIFGKEMGMSNMQLFKNNEIHILTKS